MKITKISQQIKRPDRYSIYVDEKYSFSLNDYQLVSSGLRVGKEYQLKELEQLQAESEFGKAYERALNYVMIRPRSLKEINDYLGRKYLFPKPKSFVDKTGQRHFKKQNVDREKIIIMIERVIERLTDKGYINDENFAKAWVASRQLHKSLSRRKLESELRNKGISQDIIATILQKLNDSDQANIREVIDKKRRLPRFQDDTKLAQYLMRQGFNYDDIKTALKENT